METDTVQSPTPQPERRELSDEQLLAAAGRGDLACFDLLVRRHHATALRFAHRLGGDEELARDHAQEAFLSLLRAAGRYRERGRFTTYLFAVILNLVRQEARRRRRRPEEARPPEVDPAAAAEPDASPFSPAAAPSPDRELDRRELARDLAAALAELPDEQREVFVLSELEGLRYEEIATICGCPAGTVASRKHEAVRRLRRRLAGWR